MEITRSGLQPSSKGPAEGFTGDVIIDPLFQAPNPASAMGASVTFEPGARTAWHTRPLGQTLIVTSGLGRANVGRARLRKSGQATLSGFPHYRNIGMEQHLRPR